jgi:alkylation response protein AidB-like acyl-CoA dehydrogenase
MDFGLDGSQRSLKEDARTFFTRNCPIAEVRRLAETEDAYDADLWAKMADQGYQGLIFPEEYMGLGLSTFELILILEECGRAALPGPFFSTVVLAGTVLNACGSDEQKQKYLTPICTGEARSTLAILEANPSWNPADAEISTAGGKLTGEKLFVTDAKVADSIVVVARDGVYVVEAGAPGLTIVPMLGIDLVRKIYSVKFDNTPAEKLAHPEGLTRALEIASVAAAGELVGCMQAMLDLTVEYAKERKQYGKAIGSFQAVQHQCADSYIETESSRSAAYYAAWALGVDNHDASVASSIAKLYASDAGRTVGNRSIQCHGGIGFTWESDLHLFYRRAKALETMLGDPLYHRERIASLVIDQPAAQPA